MKAILVSNLGTSVKVGGRRIPAPILEANGLQEKIKSIWPQEARVLLVFASPNEYERNDGIYACVRESIPMSGLSFASFEGCDDRNEAAVEHLDEIDVIILAGGHVPTQNAFFKKLGLREKLENFHGIVLGWSAGSMNCAEIVYAAPEADGEALNPEFQRFIPGLGLTKTNIFPHFQKLRDEILDGMRVVEDITYGDSFGHEILALNDGSYLVVEDGTETIYGDAFLIKDGVEMQICRDGEAFVWKA